MAWMERGAAGLVRTTVAALALAAGIVYAMNIGVLPAIVGVASGLLLTLALLPVHGVAPSVISAVVTFVLGVMLVGTTGGDAAGHAARIIHDIGWTEAALGAWLAYHAVSLASAGRRSSAAFGDAARERWRGGDLRIAAELARRVPVGAQAHWVALVVETAWPEPRPALVSELLAQATAASRKDIADLRERMTDKGALGASEARWDLARAGCEVLEEALARTEAHDFGGPAANRFVVAAAKVVRDDEDAVRIFAAVVLPAAIHSGTG